MILTFDGNNTDDFFRQYISSLLTRKVTKSKPIKEFKKHYFNNVDEVDKLSEFKYTYGSLANNDDGFEDNDDIDEITDEEIENRSNIFYIISITDYLNKIVSDEETYK